MDALALQMATGVSITAVAGTLALFVLFLSLIAHIAAWNILGDVELKKAFIVSPAPVAIAVVSTPSDWDSFVTLTLAFGFNFDFVEYLYGRSIRLSAYVIVIHFVISMLLSLVLFGLPAILLIALL